MVLIHPKNEPGSLHVGTSCINCGTCRALASQIFKKEAHGSVVARQPENTQEWTISKIALLSCPTNSIGVSNSPADFKSATVSVPMQIEEEVYYCGYSSPKSYGAASYFIRRPDGNILVDSPRFHHVLVKQLEQLGGIRTMFLTHKDDVADHELFRRHFGCERFIHTKDVTQDTQNVETKMEGFDPISVSDPSRLVVSAGV